MCLEQTRYQIKCQVANALWEALKEKRRFDWIQTVKVLPHHLARRYDK